MLLLYFLWQLWRRKHCENRRDRRTHHRLHIAQFCLGITFQNCSATAPASLCSRTTWFENMQYFSTESSHPHLYLSEFFIKMIFPLFFRDFPFWSSPFILFLGVRKQCTTRTTDWFYIISLRPTYMWDTSLISTIINFNLAFADHLLFRFSFPFPTRIKNLSVLVTSKLARLWNASLAAEPFLICMNKVGERQHGIKQTILDVGLSDLGWVLASLRTEM